jgi:hypothetical protein
MKYLLAIAIIALPLIAKADEPARLGRLFFTPAERASLDVLRANNKAPDKVIKAEDISKDEILPAVESAPVAKQAVIMNGYVSRSDGKNTLWVNDHEVSEKNANKDISIGHLKNNQVKVIVDKNKVANLKPGQVYDPNTGKIYNHLSEAPKPVAPEQAESESTKPDAAATPDKK